MFHLSLFLAPGGFLGLSPLAWVTSVVVPLVLIYFFVLRQTQKPHQPPLIGGNIPFLGAALDFGKHPYQFATKCYEKYGDCFTLFVLGKRLTFLVGPDAHQYFFKAPDEELSQNECYQFAVPIFGPGVVYDVSLERRTQQLRFMSNSLKRDKLKTYVEKIIFEAEMFFDKWGDSGVVDIRDAFSELIILTASRCLMGVEIREHLHEKVAALYQTLDEGLTTLSFFWPYAPTPAHRRRDRARLEMVELFSKVITERRKHPEVEHDDVLQVLMDARYKDGNLQTDAEVTGMMIALLFAGQHTSSITASWTGLLLLAHKAKFLAPVLEEQHEVLAKHGGHLSMDALNDMERLHRCMKEALRMFPPLIFLMRYSHKDVQYKNFTIPAGDTLFVSPPLSHRVPEVYADPESFDPDRFAPPREEDKKQPFSYIGFGGGRHGCMGEQFAYLQVKTIWSVLLRKFEMELASPLPEPDYAALVVGPKHPCLVRYKRIKT